MQVLNPIQISAKGMDPVQLKKEFGKDMVFWGGGFVFTQVHNILADISPEKVMTIYQAALDARKG